MTALYVVGFMLDAEREHVVLIEKARPAWQAGKLNGVGGKIEKGETPHEAMAREFEEETGLATGRSDWRRICTISWPDDQARVGSDDRARVVFFRSVYAGERPLYEAVRSQTDEPVMRIPLQAVQYLPVIPNLRWLVPLAAYTADTYEPFEVEATVAEILG